MARLSLTESELATQAGTAATVRLTLTNDSDRADRFEIRLEGIDVEWVAIPVPTLSLEPGEQRTESILIKPPRTTESRAGRYPFTVSARSLETGEEVEALGLLDVEPFDLITIEVEPKRGSAGYFRKQASFTVSVANLGNTDVNLQMFADDPEDACTYQYAQERISLNPGQQKNIPLIVQPRMSPLIGSPRLYGFAVSARGIENPRLHASTQAQLEQKAMLTPAALLVSLMVMALGFVWYLLRPTPPQMDSFGSSSTTVTEGDRVTLSWSASRAQYVVIADGERIWPRQPASGTLEVVVTKTTTFTAKAVNAAGESGEVTTTVTVLPKEVIPEPEIGSFAITPAKANLGDTLRVRYRVSNAVKVLLQPVGIELPVNQQEFEFVAERAGRVEYHLVAYNAEGKAVTKSASVEVAELSQARIIEFRALVNGVPIKQDEEVEPFSRVTIEWQVEGAARVEIRPSIGLVSATGATDVMPEQTTTYTLTAKDSQGRAVTAEITVRIKAPERDASPSRGGG
ncbi:MAG: hypothetical protein C4341_06375 [Armatimonadota bacterium]